MKLTNKGKMLAMILAICFVAYNVILFVLSGFSGHTGVFWMSWSFMIVAFAAMTVVGVLLGKRGMFLRDWLFGYPIVKHSMIYILVEFAASTVFIIFEKTVLFGWAFAVQFLFLCIYGVCAISCFLAKETIEEVHNKVSDKTRFLKLLRVDTEMLVEKCPDDALKGQLQQLSEAVRYSDPMSNEALFELEKEITLAVDECGKAIDSGNLQNAAELCTEASRLLTERNKKCKALKG